MTTTVTATTQDYTYAPHLAEYNAPLGIFMASKPQYTHFIVGGHIFSHTSSATRQAPSVLLLQRSLSDSYPGCWEGPGGACESSDASILAGTAREIFEETGLHVSKVVDLIAMDEWVDVKRGTMRRFAKYTFLVEVHEADGLVFASGSSCVIKGNGCTEGLRWEDRVRVDPTEHQAYAWVAEDELTEVDGCERYRSIGDQARTLLRGFEMVKSGLGAAKAKV
ncbi:hypothetical protein BDW42DRAFT_180206 [Aspergillus taichungensis]|uniref:Nudix hydrolase domain-containing protein n=1 Tax=Aspergillus taichungensis TaxID=482145 RepID=A0A2J5HFM8_9EURO|nr:hypothetical protein BDW42DRAFT_180206 [Aspergillus taichungensis]